MSPFPVSPKCFGFGDVFLLAALIASAEKNYHVLAAQSAINPVSCANMYAQFGYAFADRLAVTKVPGFNLTQSKHDACFRQFVSNCRDPLSEWVSSVLLLVVDELYHREIVA